MSKTTFIERVDKIGAFFDNVFHHHKATYKGMGQFFQNYADIERNYSNALLWHSQTTVSVIPDIKKEQPSVQQGVKEICGNLEKVSQLHFNFSERLREMSNYYKDEYTSSKKKKEIFMKEKIDLNLADHDNIKSCRDRDTINNKEKAICKDLYQALDEYMDQEISRTQKLKEQMVIYFSLSKKIAERKIELSSTNNLKMAHFDVYVKVSQLEGIENMIVDQFNGYGGEKIERKDREANLERTVRRESLRESIIHKQKACRFEESLTRMNQVLVRYKGYPEELNYPSQEDYLIGIFDKRVIPNYKKYSRIFSSEALKEISFAWISSFYSGSDEEEAQSLLTVAKVHMRVRKIEVAKAKDVQTFVAKFMEKAEPSHKSTLWFLIQISQVYEGTLRIIELQKILANHDLPRNVEPSLEHPIHWKISLVIIDSLLESVIIMDRPSFLDDEYIQLLQLIITFGKTTFNLPATIIIAMLLRKIKRVLEVTSSQERESLEELISTKFDLNDEFSQTEELKLHICHRVIHFITEKMSTFYKNLIDFSNLVKLSLAVEKVLPKNYFTAMEHMHSCIKIAGFNFFQDSDEDHKVTQGLWNGEERLRNLTLVLEELELEKINSNYLEPMAEELSKLLGVGCSVVISKMKKNFSLPIFQIIECNLDLLNEQYGVDKEGYALRLGICLAFLDIQQPQPLSHYTIFFKVLQNYLSSTEKDYSQLLENARKTELWIVQENSQATQNCIDFCSLLYKPFEFLLISLKRLEEEHEQTEFTMKYSHFIKIRLNDALKGQIENYVKFLNVSLHIYNSSEPTLTIKYKRLPSVLTVKKEDESKEQYSFREATRRLYNLIFLKDQLNELVCDFIDKEIYREISSSIFNLSQLQNAAAGHPAHERMLLNIHSIASLISQTEKELVTKLANISVFHFMKRVFANLYYQEEKGFFASDKDYKLSEYTFLREQARLEQLLLNISRTMPAEIVPAYSIEFCKSLVKAYRYQVLDTNKFKIPIKQDKIISYLEADLNFFCNLAKQKFMSHECVKEYLEEPCHAILRDLERNSQKLMERFSECNIKNESEEVRYYLLLLNLRKEEKAEEFVVKYKKFVK